ACLLGGSAFVRGELAGGERTGPGASVGGVVAEPPFGDDGVVELAKHVLEVLGRGGEFAGRLTERGGTRLGRVAAARGGDPGGVGGWGGRGAPGRPAHR